MKAILFSTITALFLISPFAQADDVADVACRGFGTTMENCLNMAGTYNCVWFGCTSYNQIYAGVCHLNKDANTCSTNNAGGNCVWLGCQARH